MEGKPLPNRVLMVRFTETEANVPTIVQKLMLDLKTTEPLVLTDTNWTEIMDSEGTRGSCVTSVLMHFKLLLKNIT